MNPRVESITLLLNFCKDWRIAYTSMSRRRLPRRLIWRQRNLVPPLLRIHLLSLARLSRLSLLLPLRPNLETLTPWT